MDTLTYTLEGTNLLSFDLDTTTTPGSAQIQTKTGVTYDHEVKSSYSVVVKADDGHGGTPARVTVTIEITDVDEPPDPPDAPMVTATAGSSTSLDVSWTAPATTGPDIDNYDLQYREGTSGGLDQRPPGRDRHQRRHSEPGRRDLVPGAGARHQRRGRQRLVAVGERDDHRGAVRRYLVRHARAPGDLRQRRRPWLCKQFHGRQMHETPPISPRTSSGTI